MQDVQKDLSARPQRSDNPRRTVVSTSQDLSDARPKLEVFFNILVVEAI
jgi:hypothetical protein